MGALSGVYYAAYARERIAVAQRTLAEHTVSVWTGCCVECGRAGPCPERVDAEGVLVGYLRLPRRRPGASLRSHGSAQETGAGFDWFADGSDTGPANPRGARR